MALPEIQDRTAGVFDPQTMAFDHDMEEFVRQFERLARLTKWRVDRESDDPPGSQTVISVVNGSVVQASRISKTIVVASRPLIKCTPSDQYEAWHDLADSFVGQCLADKPEIATLSWRDDSPAFNRVVTPEGFILEISAYLTWYSS